MPRQGVACLLAVAVWAILDVGNIVQAGSDVERWRGEALSVVHQTKSAFPREGYFGITLESLIKGLADGHREIPSICLRNLSAHRVFGCNTGRLFRRAKFLAKGRQKLVYKIDIDNVTYAVKSAHPVTSEKVPPLRGGGPGEIVREVALAMSLQPLNFVLPLSGYCLNLKKPWVMYPIASLGNAWLMNSPLGKHFGKRKGGERPFVRHIPDASWLTMARKIAEIYYCMEYMPANQSAILLDTGPKQFVVDSELRSYITDIEGMRVLPRNGKIEDKISCVSDYRCLKVHPGEQTPDHRCIKKEGEESGHCNGIDTRTSMYQLCNLFLSTIKSEVVQNITRPCLSSDPNERPTAWDVVQRLEDYK